MENYEQHCANLLDQVCNKPLELIEETFLRHSRHTYDVPSNLVESDVDRALLTDVGLPTHEIITVSEIGLGFGRNSALFEMPEEKNLICIDFVDNGENSFCMRRDSRDNTDLVDRSKLSVRYVLVECYAVDNGQQTIENEPDFRLPSV